MNSCIILSNISPLFLNNKIFSCRVHSDVNAIMNVQVDVQIKVVAKQLDMQQHGQVQEIVTEAKVYMPMHHTTMQQSHSNTGKQQY